MRRVATVATLASIGAVALFAGTAQAHRAACTETTNPHGQTTPPAGSTTPPGPNGGQNDDGFYKLTTNTGVELHLDQGRRERDHLWTVCSRDEDQVHPGPRRDPESEEDRKHHRPGRCGQLAYHRHGGCLRLLRRQRSRALPGPPAAKVIRATYKRFGPLASRAARGIESRKPALVPPRRVHVVASVPLSTGAAAAADRPLMELTTGPSDVAPGALPPWTLT